MMQAYSPLAAETNRNAGYPGAIRAFFRDIMKYSD